jgi:hypothetical protein
MCEIPSNVIRAEEFAERFDGFSIGSNDLTQLTLGVDRDSGELSALFKERDPAVLWMIEQAIAKAHATGSKIGLCGQAPSNDPDFAKLLVKAGIDSISVTPDSFLDVKRNVAAAEDKVYSLMGREPETYIAALGTLKAGSVFTPLFSAFGPEPIRTRMEIGEANAVVTTEALYKRKIASKGATRSRR